MKATKTKDAAVKFYPLADVSPTLGNYTNCECGVLRMHDGYRAFHRGVLYNPPLPTREEAAYAMFNLERFGVTGSGIAPDKDITPLLEALRQIRTIARDFPKAGDTCGAVATVAVQRWEGT